MRTGKVNRQGFSSPKGSEPTQRLYISTAYRSHTSNVWGRVERCCFGLRFRVSLTPQTMLQKRRYEEWQPRRLSVPPCIAPPRCGGKLEQNKTQKLSKPKACQASRRSNSEVTLIILTSKAPPKCTRNALACIVACPHWVCAQFSIERSVPN